jgi:hypothetical protein
MIVARRPLWSGARILLKPLPVSGFFVAVRLVPELPMGEMPAAHHSAPSKTAVAGGQAFHAVAGRDHSQHGLAGDGAELGESPMKMQSVIVAYALTTAMLIPATGWVADRFGTRRVYGWAIGCLCWARCCARSRPACRF